jgi:hypothetical protein
MSTELLTDANRLAYISSHEAQEPSGSGPWAQRGSYSDEEYDIRGADQLGAASSQCSLGEEEGKERVKPKRRRYMTRSSFQKGYVFSRTTERGTVYVIRYRVRSTDGRWRHKAETVNSPRRKDAERILSERLREVNRGVRLPVETSFSDFVSSHWETYISQNLKPSTQASHRSNVRTHLLPSFGNLLPWPLAEAYAELFLRPTALLPKSRLRSMEHVEEHRHAEGSECINEPREQRYRRSQSS